MNTKNKKILLRITLGTFALLIVRSVAASPTTTTTTDDNSNGNSDDTTDNAQTNLTAFLRTIQYAEGTFNQSNPYAVTYAYKHIIKNFSNHPAITGEWNGEILPDRFCTAVGLGTGCKSTAAGAYQIILPTWNDLKKRLPFLTFQANDQDTAAINLIERKGALGDIETGNFQRAIRKCNTIWASLPDSPYGQPTRSMGELETFYLNQGGNFLQA